MGNLIRNGNTGNLLRNKTTGNLVNMLLNNCSTGPFDCVECNVGTVLDIAECVFGTVVGTGGGCDADCLMFNNSTWDAPQVTNLFSTCYWQLDTGINICNAYTHNTQLYVFFSSDNSGNLILCVLLQQDSFLGTLWKSGSLGVTSGTLIDCDTLGTITCNYSFNPGVYLPCVIPGTTDPVNVTFMP